MELSDQTLDPGFWKDQGRAKMITGQIERLNSVIADWENLEKQLQELETYAQLLHKDRDQQLAKEFKILFDKVHQAANDFRIRTFLSEKYDDHDCLLSLHSGAGGTDAQDWAAMLLRMYLRYCEKAGYEVDLLHKSAGAEAGIKTAVLAIKGFYAFGHLRSEAGVHRLIRLSPFNPTHTRETSFALVEVLPELEVHEEVKLDPKELKIETSTARGHGGQSVNTTYSAVRITHVPTGIKVSIQNERSQQQNKVRALKILQSRLKVLEEEKLRQEKKKIRGEFHSAEWGNQIRSYT
ncbi:MAG: PCRF domain-containing protein, partial [Candidatus Doudnabacteria bacterium]|nr:PCRF domain-containing protein [Candidatus Doudnabacteria bacterium]